MTDRDNFSDKKLALLPNSFWKSHHFIMRWHFSLDVLCVKEHEHWYSGISSEFIMHNTRVIGLQIASKETWKRSPYSASLVWLAMWNVHGRTQRKKCSVSHWKFLKKGGFSASLPLIVQAYSAFEKRSPGRQMRPINAPGDPEPHHRWSGRRLVNSPKFRCWHSSSIVFKLFIGCPNQNYYKIMYTHYLSSWIYKYK